MFMSDITVYSQADPVYELAETVQDSKATSEMGDTNYADANYYQVGQASCCSEYSSPNDINHPSGDLKDAWAGGCWVIKPPPTHTHYSVYSEVLMSHLRTLEDSPQVK